ncbi:F-box only protein 36b isoform X2 [Phycodurus eques]|uniref:F-box only protein 36b isoform X2 n=1 Tax=Phycodurus eques TaxID=693459 RepID=UPI002ACEBF5A|nr:F-box only protein 36b isoform X2 [Phycodurus eques]XP_061550353.1 F-box only protein 36b isoform X2 [Phycodurus eques]
MATHKPIMASLLTDPLFEISGRGPSTNKNFYNCVVTKEDVIWRWWMISPRAVYRLSKPGQMTMSHEDFLDDSKLQNELGMIFGYGALQYTKALCQGHFDYLARLPDSLLLQIVNYLELEDVGQLGRTSHRFRELCGSEEFWEQAVRRCCKTVSPEVPALAREVGWRSIFFTNKLQLQKLLSRRRLRAEEEKAELTPGKRGKADVTEDSMAGWKRRK